MKAEIYAINGRISFVGEPEYIRDEIIEQIMESLGQTICRLYRKKVQEVESPSKGLVVFRVEGEEVGRVQHDVNEIRYRVMHPEMSLDDLSEGNRMSIERAQEFLDTISA